MSTPSVDPSGRVQVIPAPIASPGQCVICGKAEHEKGFVDLRLDFEFYGTLYFCADCAGELGAAVGFVSGNDIASMRQRLERQDDELVVLREAILGLESEVDGLLKYRDRLNKRNEHASSAPDVPPVADPDPGLPADAGRPTEPAGPPPEPPVQGRPPERRPDQPTNVQRPDDLLDLDESNSLLGIEES